MNQIPNYIMLRNSIFEKLLGKCYFSDKIDRIKIGNYTLFYTVGTLK